MKHSGMPRTPAPAGAGAGSRSHPFVSLLAFALPLWRWILLSAALGVATIASGVGLLAASAWIIATAALQPSIAVLQVAIVGVRFFGISRGVFRYLERLISHEVTFRLLARLRVWFYERLEPLAPAALQGYHSGDLLSRIVGDTGTLENFYVRVLAPPLVALLTAGGLWLFFSRYAASLAWTLLGFLALAGIGLPWLSYRMAHTRGRNAAAARAHLNALLVDQIQGLADILAFGGQGAGLGRVAEATLTLGRLQSRMAALRGLNGALGSLVSTLAVASVVALAIPLVRAGRLNGVDLAVLAMSAAAAFEAVLPLPLATQYLEGSLEAARRLFAIADQQPPVVEPPGFAAPTSLAPRHTSGSPVLRVNGLSFRYTADAPLALDDVSFGLEQGRCLGIAGPSGAGKSTVINLLLRFWDYQEGQIELFGRELRSYGGDEARRLMAVVSQSAYLFNATLRDNLLLARPAASQADLEQAAQAAGIHEFICALPQGYETWTGEQGLRLSGGERQRISIARALLKDAPLLILDEATANLDPVTERAVLSAIQTLMRGRATLMITHRLPGLEQADEILVLQSGRIAERGSHANLLGQGGLYRQLWNYQMQDAAVETLVPA